MIKYVAGLLYNDDATAVALVRKERGPAFAIGKWNAIGGKIEEGEESSAAMQREFQEEAGVSVSSWQMFLQLSGCGWSVDFYKAFSSSALESVQTCETEQIETWKMYNLPEIVSNLHWIMPMSLCHQDDNVEVYFVEEGD